MTQNIERNQSDNTPPNLHENLGRVYVRDPALLSDNETYGTYNWSTLPNGREGFVEEIHIPTFRLIGSVQEK